MKDLLSQIKELAPIPTEQECVLTPLENIKCVIFDIYGTLIISASGDIGSSELIGKSAIQAFEHCGIKIQSNISIEDAGRLIISEYEQEIRNSHDMSREKGVMHPEVDIQEIWKSVIDELKHDCVLDKEQKIDVERLSITFEFFNNPLYPMPNFIETLQALDDSPMTLGIVSNAQFFTPRFINHFISDEFNKSELPWFDKNIVTYSFDHGIAKPDLFLYEKTKEKIEKMGFKASNCLFVGNDMLNDIYPAHTVGFKTALFAGDLRSLRLRKNNKYCVDIVPDCIINDLNQIKSIIGLK